VTGDRLPPSLERLVPVPTRRFPTLPLAEDLVGTDLGGSPVRITVRGVGHWTLLLFLSSRCDGCRPLWAACEDPVGAGLGPRDEVVVVTRDRSHEPLDELRALAGDEASVVMSSRSWRAYRVHGPPFFSLVEGTSGRVASEGVVWSIEQVAADVARARTRQPS
jgi:hypothetical protein